jgi:hypothetical protein
LVVLLALLRYQLVTATWRSGYAAVCKTVYPGSIPGVASSFKINNLVEFFEVGFKRRFWCL